MSDLEFRLLDTISAIPAVGPGALILPLPLSFISKNVAFLSLTAAQIYFARSFIEQNCRSDAHQRGGRKFEGNGCQGGSRFLRSIKAISRYAKYLSPLSTRRTFNKTSAVPFCTTPHMRHPSRVVPSDQAF